MWLPVELVPLLVEPVVSRDSDITLTQHADSVSADRLSGYCSRVCVCGGVAYGIMF